MLTQTVPPAALVTLAEAKSALRISHSRDDVFIQGAVDAAIQYLSGPNGVLGQLLGAQSWRWKTSWFCDTMRLPIGPASAITGITYLDAYGVQQTVNPTTYYLFADAKGPYLKVTPGNSWPSTMARDDAVTIDFTGGITPLPMPLRSAILLLVSHLNEFREVQVTEQTFPTGFGLHDLITPYRRVF